MDTSITGWALALDHYGTQVGLAAALGVTQATVSRRLAAGAIMSAEDAVRLEQATEGALPRYRLRPDLWQEIARPGPLQEV